MKYIVYKQPENSSYPWELPEILFIDSGFILTEISEVVAKTFNWVKWSASEVTEDLANGSLWANCIIKDGQTTRYRKWVPEGTGETVPTLQSNLAGSSTENNKDSLKHLISADEDIAGGEWNKFIINKVIQEVFDSRFSAIDVKDNELEASTYQVQLAEAKAFTLDNKAKTPVLDILTTNRNISVAALAVKIIEADTVFNTRVAQLLVSQKTVQDKVKEAVGIDETLLLKEDLVGVMVEAGLAISSGRSDTLNRTVKDTAYGIQF
jgi:hypothetical protein